MSKYRKKPIIIEAVQWFKVGDHLRVFAYSHIQTRPCTICLHALNAHGEIRTLEGLHIVCPGDWIITGIKGEHYPCKDDIFEASYEKVEE